MAAKTEAQWEEFEGEELVSLDIPPEYQTLVTEEVMLSVRDLWSRFLSGELILEPDFQRHYVWDRQRASRFIESLLLGLPVPSLFLAENLDGTVDVIDGHQRLETLFRFMQPLLAGPSGERWPKVKGIFASPLTLTGCEVLTNLSGKGVTTLDISDRSKLWDRRQRVIWVKKDANPDMKFVLFARLNLGAMALNPQELRNCLYRGPYNNLIAQLAEAPKVLKVFGRREPDKRMSDRELVLRFFALAHRRERYRTPFRSFLNEEMAANQHACSDDLLRYRAEFQQALDWSSRAFPGAEFRLFRVGREANPNGFWERRRMHLVYETEMVGFYQFRDRLEEVWSGLVGKPERERDMFLLGLRRRLINTMVGDAFQRTLAEQTTAPHILRQRFDGWFQALRGAVDNWEGIIEETSEIVSLLRTSTACNICPGHIGSAEDAVVMFVNGRKGLAHRFCAQYASAKHT